ncbi:MAG: ABC transporter substrate-binding protein [Desulfonauticus sp.]|nr:ABC transporter substrate-binding protein [Desulfonauticus sp.]
MKRWCLGVLIIVFLSGCNSSPSPTIYKPCGVYPDKIIIGSSLALSGHAGYLGTQFLKGALAYLKAVNNKGGIWGRKIILKYYDDAYDPPRCLYNTQKLIIEDKVFALFCYVGTPTTLKVIPFVNGAKIPLIGMFTGAHALRKPFNPYLINVRPSYYEETSQAIDHLVKDLNLRKIAIFYQYDAYGFDGLTGTELALHQYNLKPITRASYIRGTLHVEKAFAKIYASHPDTVVMVGTYEPCAKFIQLASAKHFRPVFYLTSFVGAKELARRIKKIDQNVIVSQVMPNPTIIPLSDKNGYTYLLKKYFPEEQPSFVGLEGFVNAKVLVKGLQNAGQFPTRQKLIAGIENLHNFNLGYGIVINFSKHNHQGLNKVYFTIIKNGKIKMLYNWKKEIKIR